MAGSFAQAARARLDPFVAAIVATLLLGLVVPVPAGGRTAVAAVADVAVVLLFLAYGMRLRTAEVVASLRNARLQGAVLAATYVAFPVLGLAVSAAARPALGPQLATGLLFVSLLPGTIQSSIALTGVARGNLPSAISAATLSNVTGMLLTPALVLLLLGQAATPGFGGARAVLLQLLLPFVVGQLLQGWAGPWARRHPVLMLIVDRGTILIVVFSGVTAATAAGVWAAITPLSLGSLVAACLVVLAVMLTATWWAARRLHLPAADRVVLLLCGSQKSLATGLPMAGVLFPAATAATVAVPVILFHQLQMIVGAVIARRLARRPSDPPGS